MKLFYYPGACSLAPHIVAREASVAIELVRVDLANQTTETQEDFKKINPRGYVPVLEIDGELHTEVVALVQYLAEQSPRSTLLPAAGTAARFRVNQWLGFVASELHKTLSPWLIRKDAAESTRQAVRETLAMRLADLESQFKAQPYLTGEHFTVADAYTYTVLSWSNFVKIDLNPYPGVRAFMARVSARPRVREALEAEGLVPVPEQA
jgi:glutathione S-transferase